MLVGALTGVVPAAGAGGLGTEAPRAGQRAAADSARWRSHSEAVLIIRDTWGIAHVYGRSDADAVFGAMYAQAEDDFHRIEHNYLIALGRLAEAEGESQVYSDLRQRLFIDPTRLKRQYQRSPAWLKSLMVAWADGLNFYLATHPAVRPLVLTHFDPWMALSFTEGSIGGDIETVDLGKTCGVLPRSCRARKLTAPRRVERHPGSHAILARRLQRLRDRTQPQRFRTRSVVDQSAHLLLFPCRAANDQ